MHSPNDCFPRPQLFLIHFAGGSSYSFNHLLPHAEKYFNVIPLELPGRGNRVREPLISDFDMAVLDVYKQVKRKVHNADYVLFGHSMGASLGLAVCRLLEQEQNKPSCLIVSGNAGPDLEREMMHTLEGEDFKDKIFALGGTPREVLDDTDLFNFIEPIIRADFQVAEKNGLAGSPPVRSPILAIMGNEETHVKQIGNWCRYSTGPVEFLVLPGDHFFINQHPAEITSILKKYYDKCALQ